jgi:hypothetical protein
LPPTAFSWTTGGNSSFSISFTSTGLDFGRPIDGNWYTFTGDWNGDGKTDFAMLGGTPVGQSSQLFVFMSNGDGTFTTTLTTLSGMDFGLFSTGNWYTFTGDWNGDGKTDFVMFGGTPASQASQLFVFLSNGDGTFSVTMKTLTGWDFGLRSDGNWYTFTGDWNGDGRTDFALVGGVPPSGAAELWVFLSNGDGTFTASEVSTGLDFGRLVDGNWYTLTGDWNGDGQTDFAMLGGTPSGQSSQLFTFMSNGNGIFTIALTTLTGWEFALASNANWYTFLGDWNGDGKTDFALVGGVPPSGAAQLWVFLSNGDGTFTTTEKSTGFDFGRLSDANWYPLSGDWNGDARSDFAMLGGTPTSQAAQLFTFKSNGDGTFAINFTTTTGDDFGELSTGNWYTFMGDWNGDGKTDLALLGGVPPSGAAQLFTFLAQGQPTNLMSSVSSGLGATTSITHTPLTSASVYSKDHTATYPQVDMQSPFYVVSGVANSNGVGGTYGSSYAYAGAKSDLSGRGYLGFRQMTVTDLETNIVKATNYSQAFPFIGLIATQAKTLSSTTLDQVSNTYQVTNGSGAATVSAPSVTSAPYQAFLSQRVESGNDLDGSTLPTVTTGYQYDAFGNGTQITVSTSDGFSKTTTNTFTNDTTNWFLGRLTNASVNSSTP